MRFMILLMMLCIGTLATSVDFQRSFEDLGALPDEIQALSLEFQNIEDFISKNWLSLGSLPAPLIRILVQKISVLREQIYYYYFGILEQQFLRSSQTYDSTVTEVKVKAKRYKPRKIGGVWVYRRVSDDDFFVKQIDPEKLVVGQYIINLFHFDTNPFDPKGYIEPNNSEIEQIIVQ